LPAWGLATSADCILLVKDARVGGKGVQGRDLTAGTS